MKSNQNCPNCSASIDPGSKFCGGCGSKIPSNNSQIAVDLFSIDSQESPEPEQDQWDEFLDTQPKTLGQKPVEDDFFAIDDDFEQEETELEDTQESKPPIIEKKLLTEDNDPSIKSDPSIKEKKTVDKKLRKAIKKKNALKIKSKETKISFLIFGLLSLLVSIPLLSFAIIEFLPKNILAQIPLESLKVFSHPLYACVFFIPSIFRLILNSKMMIKVKSRKQFSQYFAFCTSVFLMFLCTCIYQSFLNDPKNNLLFSLDLNKTAFSVDHFYLSIFSFLLFCQIVIAYLFSKKIPFIISSFLSSSLLFSNLQLFVYLAIPNHKLLFDDSSNILGQQLAYYLGSLHSYVMPNYLLSQIVLPGFILLFIILAIKDLFTKDITNFFYGFYSICIFSVVFLYINHSYLQKDIYTLSHFLKPIYQQISNFI
ncbi:MAG: zinc ribbon domain-containing protein [Candidatus Cloacimonetes bacterium]|nr:zinc ribbon domain-containing protein [Candidatus Cloacimonadota bacterium]